MSIKDEKVFVKNRYGDPVKPFNKEEEIYAFKRYHKATGEEKTEIRNIIISKYTGIVLSIVNNICRDENVINDLLQEGMIKLMEHIDKFKPGEVRFSTWLYTVIKYHTLLKIRMNTDIKIPPQVIQDINVVDKYTTRIISDRGYMPKPPEIAEALDMKVDYVRRLLSMPVKAEYLNEDDMDHEPIVERHDQLQTNASNIDFLHSSMKKDDIIVKMRFGIGNRIPRPTEQVLKIFGITKEEYKGLKDKCKRA